ncbi:MAG: hypothetical protein HY819_17075 [Acidobacteria bacterium]|nr:hypothetical protein [Acidobacteriota bacterium]
MLNNLVTQQNKKKVPSSEINQPFKLERLEYGKFCVLPNRKIEGIAEHRQLGRSPGFPLELVPLCDPSIIGTMANQFDEIPKYSEHSTLLRPLVTQEKKIAQLLYKTRLRLEAGDIDRKNTNYSSISLDRYTIARYLITLEPEQVTPLTLLNAMNSERLKGLTREEAKNLSPIFATKATKPPVVEEFLKQAIVYILSGIPIAIVDPITEEEFFDLIETLWYLLPEKLRPLMSAGWNVGSFLSGKLLVSYSPIPSDNSAIFSWKTRGWIAPKQIFIPQEGRIIKKDYTQNRLLPGIRYSQYAYLQEDGSMDISELTNKNKTVIETFSNSINIKEILDTVNQENFLTSKKYLDFSRNRIIRIFRDPGLMANDFYHYSLLYKWLGSSEESEVSLPTNYNFKNFTFLENKIDIIQLAIKTNNRNKGDLILWHTLNNLSNELPDTQKELINFIEKFSGKISERLRLLLAVSKNRQIPLETLKKLNKAAQVGEANNFIKEIEEKIYEQLNETINLYTLEIKTNNPNYVSLYEEHKKILLLGLDLLPSCYLRWIRTNDNAIRLTLVFLKEIDSVFMERLWELTKCLELEVARKYAKEEPLSENDRLILSSFPGKSKQVFAQLMLKKWSSNSPKIREIRENLLSWIEALDPPISQNILLRIFLGLFSYEKPKTEKLNSPISEVENNSIANSPLKTPIEEVTAEEIKSLILEIENDSIPNSLLLKVSIFILNTWNSFSKDFYLQSIDSKFKTWERVINCWPSKIKEVLLISYFLKNPNSFDHDKRRTVNLEVSKAAEDFQPTQRILDEIFDGWANFIDKNSKNKNYTIPKEVASLLWKWTVNLTNELRDDFSTYSYQTLRATHICLQLYTGSLDIKDPVGNTDKSLLEKRLVIVAEVVKLDTSAQKMFNDKINPLWEGAKDIWSIRLLLKLYSSELHTLESFQPSSEQLKVFIKNKDVIKKENLSIMADCPTFALALLDFHKLSYTNEKNFLLWRDDLKNSPVWAVFSAVPSHSQGSLKEALDIYSKNLHNKIELCHKYINGFSSLINPLDQEKEQLSAANKILIEFLIEELHKSLHTSQLVKSVFELAENHCKKKKPIFSSYIQKENFFQLPKKLLFGSDEIVLKVMDTKNLNPNSLIIPINKNTLALTNKTLELLETLTNLLGYDTIYKAIDQYFGAIAKMKTNK